MWPLWGLAACRPLYGLRIVREASETAGLRQQFDHSSVITGPCHSSLELLDCHVILGQRQTSRRSLCRCSSSSVISFQTIPHFRPILYVYWWQTNTRCRFRTNFMLSCFSTKRLSLQTFERENTQAVRHHGHLVKLLPMTP